MEHIKEVLDKILKNLYLQKPVLSFDEACTYCSLSKSKMYKHTSNNNIPFYKPEGKLIFFKREELEVWLLRNRQSSLEEMEDLANNHSLKMMNKR